MSVENLRAGLSDLTSGVKTMRAAKEAKAKRIKDAADRQSLAESFSNSAEGQTQLGQTLSQGIASGKIDPKAAISTFANLPRPKLLMMIQAAAQAEQDPVKKRQLMAAASQAMETYNSLNEDEAYHKARGKLYAKQGPAPAGDPAAPSGARGRPSGAAPGRAPGSPTDQDNLMNTVPYTLKLNDFAKPLNGFLEKDPLWSDKTKTDPKQGYLGQTKWTQDEKKAFRERLHDFSYNQIRQSTELGAPGFETYAHDFAGDTVERFAHTGVSGFYKTANTKDGIATREATLTKQVPQSVVFVTKATKGKNKGQVVDAKINPAAGKPAFGIGTADKLQPKISPKLQADADYYLGK